MLHGAADGRYWFGRRRRGDRSNVLGFPDVRPVPVFIYGLAGADGVIRYIGKSSNPKNRLTSHRARSGAPRVRNWIASVEAAGEKVRIVILHRIPPGIDGGPYELAFIREYRKQGGLLNAEFAVERSPLLAEQSPKPNAEVA